MVNVLCIDPMHFKPEELPYLDQQLNTMYPEKDSDILCKIRNQNYLLVFNTTYQRFIISKQNIQEDDFKRMIFLDYVGFQKFVLDWTLENAASTCNFIHDV